MSNVREAVAKYLSGRWYSEKAKLKIHISEIARSWIYLFRYDGGFDDTLKGEDSTEIMYDSNGNVITSNRWGKWKVKFITPNKIQLESRDKNEFKTMIFEREQ